MMETETLDKLYLELSQITKARSGRELFAHNALYDAPDIAMYKPDEFFELYTKWFENTRKNALLALTG